MWKRPHDVVALKYLMSGNHLVTASTPNTHKHTQSPCSHVIWKIGAMEKMRGERADKEPDDRFYIAHTYTHVPAKLWTILHSYQTGINKVPKVMALLFIMLMFY